MASRNGTQKVIQDLISAQANLTQAHATLAMAQAQMISVQSQLVRDLTQLRDDMSQIKAILIEHENLLKNLPEAIRQKIGFDIQK